MPYCRIRYTRYKYETIALLLFHLYICARHRRLTLSSIILLFGRSLVLFSFLVSVHNEWGHARICVHWCVFLSYQFTLEILNFSFENICAVRFIIILNLHFAMRFRFTFSTAANRIRGVFNWKRLRNKLMPHIHNAYVRHAAVYINTDNAKRDHL